MCLVLVLMIFCDVFSVSVNNNFCVMYLVLVLMIFCVCLSNTADGQEYFIDPNGGSSIDKIAVRCMATEDSEGFYTCIQPAEEIVCVSIYALVNTHYVH